MKFNAIPFNLSQSKLRKCQRKFYQLTLELGVRNTNKWVGSGLGGNNFQLLVLMNLRHQLINSQNISIRITEDGIAWGSDFLLQSMLKIRHTLDEIFPAIQAKYKVMATAIEGMLYQRGCYYNSIVEKQDSFPGLQDYLSGKEYRHDASMPLHEQLLIALVITLNLSIQLDKGDKSRIGAAGRAINQFCDEIILLSVRMNIQIDRLVHFNLDENPDWESMLNRISKGVDGE